MNGLRNKISYPVFAASMVTLLIVVLWWPWSSPLSRTRSDLVYVIMPQRRPFIYREFLVSGGHLTPPFPEGARVYVYQPADGTTREAYHPEDLHLNGEDISPEGYRLEVESLSSWGDPKKPLHCWLRKARGWGFSKPVPLPTELQLADRGRVGAIGWVIR
jgi:hypothetical protein